MRPARVDITNIGWNIVGLEQQHDNADKATVGGEVGLLVSLAMVQVNAVNGIESRS